MIDVKMRVRKLIFGMRKVKLVVDLDFGIVVFWILLNMDRIFVIK